MDREDLAVGSHGLSSGRDREIMFSRDPVKWKQVKVAVDGDTAFEVSLPRDREMVKRAIEILAEHEFQGGGKPTPRGMSMLGNYFIMGGT